MCGIGGILRTDGQPIPEQWLDEIDARIAWRGPDGCGRFRDRVEIADESAPDGRRLIEVALVHRRLSIIDHACGAQPMVSQRGRNVNEGLVAVVFNGCIYNHRDLRRELEANGHRFTTDHSDTEVLIHGWREWREHLAHHLEGMYAFALWDRSKAILSLARDRFGEKPLYVSYSLKSNAWCVFASSHAAVESIERHVNPSADVVSVSWLRSYLQFGFVLEGSVQHSQPERIKKMKPGSALHLTLKGIHHCDRDRGAASDQFYAEDDVIALLRSSVHERLEADVPLGCFLSGGVDSSLIAHFARERLPDLHTFTVRMPDRRYDESRFAQEVADHLHTTHHTLDAEADPAADLELLIQTLGQPFGDSSTLPTFWVCRAARSTVKVALSGDGGDELFVGYERYLAARFLARHHWWLRRLPVRSLLHAHPKSRWHKAGRLVEMARDYSRIGLASMESIFSQREIAELTGKRSEEPPSVDAQNDALASLRDFDVENYLPDDLLMKVDTASMACGLEVRCPFLDRDLARAALSMPIEQLMPRGQRKGLLRQIARKYLPHEIVDRPKMGFAIPIGEWFRNDDLPHKGSGMKSLLLDYLNSAEPFGEIQLNRKAVQRYIDDHMSGKRDRGQRLFALLTLAIWARQLRTLPLQPESG